MSCERIGRITSVNLSKYTDYIINNIDTAEVEINVDTITLVEVDKRRGG